MSDDIYGDTGHGIAWAIMVVIGIVIVGSLLYWGFAVQQPAVENWNTKVIRNTNQYRTTKDTELASYIDEYGRNRIAMTKLEAGSQAYKEYELQNKTIVRRVKVRAATIGVENCTSEVQQFLKDHEKELE